MQCFDVVVIGAGPAGGQCARQLAQQGMQVLLVEQHKSFLANNYSSAASPLEILNTYQLPEKVVARYWKNLAIAASQGEHHWTSPDPQGVVFDFAKLRQFLADETLAAGGTVWMGTRFLGYETDGDRLEVQLRRPGNEQFNISTRILVDATGSKRAVIRSNNPGPIQPENYYRGIGTEYLIQVDAAIHERFADTLVFFLGYRWSPQGYSWIFPMEQQQLKVGTAIFAGQHRHLGPLHPIRHYTEAIIQDYLKPEHYDLIEIHGSTLDYAIQQSDTYHRGNVIAIGDAVSTVNFLGGEGIRHGMRGAVIAVPFIQNFYHGDRQAFADYEQAMKAEFSDAWLRTEKLSQRVYLEFSDAKIDLGVTYLKYLSYDEVLDLLFNYRFDRIYGGIIPLLLKKLAQLRHSSRQWFGRFTRPQQSVSS